MNRIDQLFQTARTQGRTVFIPFLSAGDPDLATSMRIAEGLARLASSAGVPLAIEIGFPYSDPIADGPAIQSSYTRAIERGVKIADVLEAAGRLRERIATPLVAMISFSLIIRQGGVAFLARAQANGFDGALVPDLPAEEAGELLPVAEANDFKLIQLVAPTTSPVRRARILQSASGYLYYISVTGITGERDALPAELPARLAELRAQTPLPVCVGFGISRPEQLAQLAPHVDGIIVGSALVRRIAELAPGADDLGPVLDFAARLIEPLAQSPPDRKGQK